MNTTKIIKGVVNSGRYTVTAPIVKENYGIYLQIEGVELPETYQVDFSNEEHHGASVTMIGNADGVRIPRQFIDTGKNIFAFLYWAGEDYGKTIYKFRIPNKLRPDRTDETPTPEEQSVIDQAISALNEAVAKTAQDVVDADASAQEAAESARASGESALSASNSALSSGEYASNALGYADSASNSATQAQNALSMIPSAIVETVSGGIVRFNDGADNAPMESVEIDTASETATLVRTGKNIFAGWESEVLEYRGITFTYSDDDRVQMSGTSDSANASGGNKIMGGANPVPIVFAQGRTYKVSLHGTVESSNQLRLIFRNTSGTNLWSGDSNNGVWTVTPASTFVANGVTLRVPIQGTTVSVDARLMIEVADTATSYEAFDGEVFAVNLVNGVVQEEIPTLKGANTIWSIDGDITAKYHADVTLYMDGKAEQAEQFAQRAEDALTEFTSPTASATTLQAGSDATASYSNGHFDFGIPRGADGRNGTDGTDGEDGQDGISPTVTITPITGGHRITITDADGSHSADVMDGVGSVDDVQVNGRSVLSDGVANIPIADANNSGVVIVNSNYGIDRNDNGRLMVNASTADQTKAGTNNYRPIVPSNQHSATFYGLAKSAGDTTQSQSSNAVGQYTESAKSAISEMLGGPVSVSGTTPTIVAKAGIRYVCGEVATLDFTPSATGICDVVFTSGATPTVVTLPSTVKFPDGAFTAEADTTYEINILDGVYGAVMAWT